MKPREEILETRRFPNPAGKCKIGEIEVRQSFELDDFEPGEPSSAAANWMANWENKSAS